MSRRLDNSAATPMVSSFIPCCFAGVQDLAKHRSYTDRCAGGTGKITNGPRLRRPILCWVGTQGRVYGGQYCVGSAPRAAITDANTVLGRYPGLRLPRPVLCWVGTQGGDYRDQYCVGLAPRASERLKTEVLRKFLTRFNKIAIQGAPQMAVDKEAISLSRVYSHYSKCNVPLFYV